MKSLGGAVLIAGILLTLGIGWVSERKRAERPLSGAGDGHPGAVFDVSLAGKPAGLDCSAGAGGRLVLRVAPGADRQIAVVVPDGRWLWPAKGDHQIARGTRYDLVLEPGRTILFEWTQNSNDRKEGYRASPLYQGDGVYRLMMAPILDVDQELIDPEGQCNFRIERRPGR